MSPKQKPPQPNVSDINPPPFLSEDAAACYQHFLEKVKRIADEQVEVCRLDVQLMRINVDRALPTFIKYLPSLQKSAPLTPFSEILEIGSVVRGLVFAHQRVATPASSGEIDEHLRILRPLREVFLKQLEVYALLRIVPPERVKAIRVGTGPLDAAEDGLAEIGVFTEFKGPIAGKHPFTQEQFDTLSLHANWLVAQLKPGSARPAASTRPEESTTRDRFYTETVRRFEEMRKALVSAVGLRQLDEVLPPLGTRVVDRGAAGTPTTPPAGKQPPAGGAVSEPALAETATKPKKPTAE